MSQWTHVTGCIRIDALDMIIGGDVEQELRNGFGKPVSFGGGKEAWDACTVPCGSEGSVQYEIVKTRKNNSLSWGLVYIHGDLRDYDNPHEILKWLQRACRGTFIVRGCAVKVAVEGVSSWMITNDNENNIGMFQITFGKDESEQKLET